MVVDSESFHTCSKSLIADRIKSGCRDLSESGKCSIDKQVQTLRESHKLLETPESLTKKIHEAEAKMLALENQYYSLPFQLPPLSVKRQIRYTEGNVTIRPLEDGSSKRLYLYEGSSYASPSLIITNEKNEPVKLIKTVCNSETMGRVVRFEQLVNIMEDEPEKKEVPTVELRTPPKTRIPHWMCICGTENYHERKQCHRCGKWRPKETVAKENLDNNQKEPKNKKDWF